MSLLSLFVYLLPEWLIQFFKSVKTISQNSAVQVDLSKLPDLQSGSQMSLEAIPRSGLPEESSVNPNYLTTTSLNNLMSSLAVQLDKERELTTKIISENSIIISQLKHQLRVVSLARDGLRIKNSQLKKQSIQIKQKHQDEITDLERVKDQLISKLTLSEQQYEIKEHQCVDMERMCGTKISELEDANSRLNNERADLENKMALMEDKVSTLAMSENHWKERALKSEQQIALNEKSFDLLIEAKLSLSEEHAALGSEPSLASTKKIEKITMPNTSETSADDTEVLEPSDVFPVFNCSDVRYKGLAEIPGYTVIPKQTQDKETFNLSSLNLVSDSSSPSITIPIAPLGSEPSVDLSSTMKIEKVTIPKADTNSANGKKADDGEVLEPSAVFPVFTCSDVRYKGQAEIPGYTVIPTQTHENNENVSNLILDFIRPVSKRQELPFENFYIQDEIVKTEFRSSYVLTNIPAVHFGRILGKGGKNVMALKDKFGVHISVSSPKNSDDDVRVTITSGSAADRHVVAEQIMGELPVLVEVFFGVGFLSYEKKKIVRQFHPFVKIQDIGQGKHVLSGKLRECQQAFEDLKSRQ